MVRAHPSSPSSAEGAATGLLLTAPLLALWYLASVLTALPFVPFTLFDALSRMLPGTAVTFGIDMLVRAIGALHLGPTAATAKFAEQTIAVGLVLLAGIAAGATFSSSGVV